MDANQCHQLRDWKGAEKAIRRILMDEWNPIGFDVPDDEYDSYIPGIYQLMRSGASAHEISSHLSQIETITIGLNRVAGAAERNDRVATMLLDLASQG